MSANNIVLQPLKTNLFSSPLYNLLRLVRTHGYWLSIKNSIPFFWNTRNFKFNNKKVVSPINPLLGILVDIASILFVNRRLYSLLSNCVSPFIYNLNDLRLLATSYQHVLLIQASSWGPQDSCLSFAAKYFNWSSFLYPYSTDQILANGWLLSNYDLIFPQGTAEFEWLISHHSFPITKIRKNGSLYFSSLKHDFPDIYHKSSVNISHDRILYAGLDPAYFPYKLEIEAVVFLAEAFHIHGKSLIYRPVKSSQESLASLNPYIEDGVIEISYPSECQINTGQLLSSNSKDVMKYLLDEILICDILVTSRTTSMCLEAASLGVPTISYLPHVKSTHFLAFYDSYLTNGFYPGLLGMPICRNLDHLLSLIIQTSSSTDRSKHICRDLINQWDFAYDKPVNCSFTSELHDFVV